MKNNILMSVATAATLILAGCGSTNSGDPGEKMSYKTVTLDASNAGSDARLNLVTGEKVTDNSWHFGYQKFLGFKTNGGISGSGGVTACLAKKYDDLYDTEGNPVAAEFSALNAENTEEDFINVTLADCNDSDYGVDKVETYIEQTDWVEASMGATGPVFSAKNDPSNSWIVRSAEGNTYARVKVKELDVNLSAGTRQIVLSSERYTAGSGFEAPTDSPPLVFSTDKAYWDMETNDIVRDTDDWDMAISKDGRAYPLQINGGASGSGNGGVGILINGYVESNVTDPTDRDQVYTYFKDKADGPMVGEPGDYGPYEFAVIERMKMYPTYSIYIIKKDDKYFKVQILSYYGADGTAGSGNMVVRYQELTP